MPSHLSFTVGLPDFPGLNIQSRQPTASVAVGVDDFEVTQVKDLAVLLRSMTGDDRFFLRSEAQGRSFAIAPNAGPVLCARSSEDWGRSWRVQKCDSRSRDNRDSFRET